MLLHSDIGIINNHRNFPSNYLDNISSAQGRSVEQNSDSFIHRFHRNRLARVERYCGNLPQQHNNYTWIIFIELCYGKMSKKYAGLYNLKVRN